MNPKLSDTDMKGRKETILLYLAIGEPEEMFIVQLEGKKRAA